jgi:hypothetical protein
MRAWIGLNIYRGVVRIARSSAYWAKDTAVNLFTRTMPRDRFISFNAVWHITDPEEDAKIEKSHKPHNWLFRLQPLIDCVSAACSLYYLVGEFVTVDEARVAFAGRHHAVTLAPNKPIKHGFTIHMAVCALNTFIHSFIVYEGKKGGKRVYDLAKNIVMTLADKLLDAGRVVVGDRWFTSLGLVRALRERGTGYVGTLKKHAAGFPDAIFDDGKKMTKKNRGTHESYQHDDITVTAWRDRATVFLVSSVDDPARQATVERWSKEKHKRITVRAPPAAQTYCENMGGVDRADRQSYGMVPGTATVRWWVALAWGIINIAIHNAYTLHRLVTASLGGTPLTNMQFRVKLALQLINGYDGYPRARPALPMTMPGMGAGHRLRPSTRRNICKNHAFRKRTRYWCEPCRKGMCPECYDGHLQGAWQ